MSMRLGWIAICVGLASSPLLAQNAFFDVPSEREEAEIRLWGNLYLQAKTNGPASEAKNFAFSNAQMNSPLFSPLYAAQRTASNNVTIARPCTETAAVDAVTAAYLSTGKLSTALTDERVADHLAAYMAADQSRVSLSIADGFVVTVGLPAEALGDQKVSNAPVAWPVERIGQLNNLAAFTKLAASGIDHGAASIAALTGQASSSVQMADGLKEYLAAAHADDSPRVRELALLFGRFGSVPVVEVAFDSIDQYVLVDAVTGSVFGPYRNGTPFVGDDLLALHRESAGAVSSAFVDPTTGCPIVASTRTPWTPPAAPAPGAPLPPGLTPVAPAPGSPLLPGKPSPWTCTSGVGGICTCTTTYNYVGPCGTSPPNVVPTPGGCLYKYEIVCTGSGLAPCPASSPNNTPAPGTIYPAPTPPPGATTVPAGCTSSWWYWS